MVMSVPVTVEVTGRLDPDRCSQGSCWAYLAVHPDGVRRDAVVATLWPDTGRRRPANNLSALSTRLRAALADDEASTGHRG